MEKYIKQDINQPLIANHSNKTQYFEEISLEVCNLHINSYQICKHWLESHSDCLLSNDETECYYRIVIILKEIVKLMEEIMLTIQSERLNKLSIF